MNNISIPNYDHSTLSMMQSILKYYNYNICYKSLPKLDEELSKKYCHICLFIFDGLGNISLENISKDGLFSQNKIDVISTVFPSTTVAAINTISSGIPPISHGWLGWTSYFKEVGKRIELFKNSYVGSNEEVSLDYQSILKYQNIFSKIKENSNTDCWYFSPKFIPSTMEDAKTVKFPDNKLKSGCAKLIDVLHNSSNPTFTYFYYHNPDSMMHIKGVNSWFVKRNVIKTQKIIQKTLSKCPEDTLFIISSDHGLLNVTNPVYLADDTEIYRMLKHRPSIEGRATAFFIKDKYKEVFKDAFNKKYQNDFILKSHKEVIDENIFGFGTPHPKFEDFIGDYLAIAKSNRCINYGKKQKRKLFKAAHAGLTKEETEVPLIILKK